MADKNIALLGFGNVGRAFAQLLLDKKEELRDRYGISYSVTGIATKSHGIAIDHSGIDLIKALAIENSNGNMDSLGRSDLPDSLNEFINKCGADILFENTPVNYQNGQPGLDHIRTALSLGMHAITANKGPVVHAYGELIKLAQENKVNFLFESTVMDGAPVFGIVRETLPALKILSVKGILNSTTNLILGRMEDSESLEEAIRYAQSIGIAETDPSGDIDGWDAAIKLSILCTVMMGIAIVPEQVQRTGIRDISRKDISDAANKGKRWKLMCTAEISDGSIRAIVAPQLLENNNPFYGINGTTSIVRLKSDALGDLSIIENDPSPATTAYGLLADFINAVT